MRYIGTLDDKSIEYPFGTAKSSPELLNKQLLNHILFDTDNSGDLLVEGGFLIASEEAMTQSADQSVMISAIEAGLVKVAARIHSFEDYLEDRRRLRHKVPNRDARSQAYFGKLQQACDRSSAFLNYSLPRTDVLTFAALNALSSGATCQSLLARIGPDVADRFSQFFEQTYLTGNKGGQWTARAAWEECLNQLNAPFAVKHAMMAIANRERQIIRAGAFAVENDLEITVDTGYGSTPHPLAEPVTPRSSEWTYNLANGLPKIPFKAVYGNRAKLFRELTPGINSTLKAARGEFIAARNELLQDGGGTERQKRYDRAGKNYEREIWHVIGLSPPEEKHWLRNVASVLAGVAVAKALKDPVHRICPFLDKPNRRGVLTWGTALLFTSGMTSCELILADAFGEEFAQRYADLTDGTDDGYRQIKSSPLNSHQQLKIDKAVARSYFLAPA